MTAHPTPDADHPRAPHTRWVRVAITNEDEYTANRAALSLADWVSAEFPGHQVTTDAREWGAAQPSVAHPDTDPRALLREVLALHDATHRYPAQGGGHDSIGPGLTCARCELAGRIRPVVGEGDR